MSINYRHAGRVRKRKLYFINLNSSACVGTVEFKLAKSKHPQEKLDVFLAGLFFLRIKFDKKINKTLGKNIAIREQKYREFRREFNMSCSHTDYQGLAEMAKQKYSDVIVGSDQLWLPVNVVSDYYTLNWVPDNVNKVAFSTSVNFST